MVPRVYNAIMSVHLMDDCSACGLVRRSEHAVENFTPAGEWVTTMLDSRESAMGSVLLTAVSHDGGNVLLSEGSRYQHLKSRVGAFYTATAGHYAGGGELIQAEGHIQCYFDAGGAEFGRLSEVALRAVLREYLKEEVLVPVGDS